MNLSMDLGKNNFRSNTKTFLLCDVWQALGATSAPIVAQVQLYQQELCTALTLLLEKRFDV